MKREILTTSRLLSSQQVDQSNLQLVVMAAEDCAHAVVDGWEGVHKPRGRFEVTVRFVSYDANAEIV